MSSPLIYNLNDKLPLKEAFFVSLQHVCAMFIPVCTPGLLIAGALDLNPVDASYILGMSLFVSGLGTFLQVNRLGGIGCGLLSVQGTSFAFVTPILAVVTTSLEEGKTPEGTLALILGMCLVGSLIPMILSRFLHLTKQIFTPLVTGTAVTLIGLCLIKVGMFYMAGGGKAQAIARQNPDSPFAFGSLPNWALALLAFAIVSVCSASPNRYLRMSATLLGLLLGFIASLFLGMPVSQSSALPLVNLPVPFRFGLDFNWVTFAAFAVIYLTVTLEVLGDLTATSMVSQEPIAGGVYLNRLKGGVLGSGVNSAIASVLGGFPVVTFAQNNGIIQLTGASSKQVGYYIAAIMMLLGLFPAVSGILIAIPTPVFGGAIALTFGTVAVAGFNILRTVEMDNRAFIILAASLATGLGVTFLPESLHAFPPAVRSVLESGMAVGSICALGLDLMLPKSAIANRF